MGHMFGTPQKNDGFRFQDVSDPIWNDPRMWSRDMSPHDSSGSSGPCSESWSSAEGHSTLPIFGQSSGLNLLPKERFAGHGSKATSILKTKSEKQKMLDVFGDSCSFTAREFN